MRWRYDGRFAGEGDRAAAAETVAKFAPYGGCGAADMSGCPADQPWLFCPASARVTLRRTSSIATTISTSTPPPMPSTMATGN